MQFSFDFFGQFLFLSKVQTSLTPLESPSPNSNHAFFCMKYISKEIIHQLQDEAGIGSALNTSSQFCPVANTMSKPTGKLFHFSYCSGGLFFHQHAVVRANHFIAISFRRFGESPGAKIIGHLSKNPRIRRSCPTDHHGIAPGLLAQRKSVKGGRYITVTDDGYMNTLFNLLNNIPAGAPAKTLKAGATVDGYCLHTAILGHAGHGHCNDFLIAPTNADLNGERNRYRSANLLENILQRGEIAQKAGASTFDDFFRRTSQV